MLHNAITDLYECSCPSCSTVMVSGVEPLAAGDDLHPVYEQLLADIFAGELIAGDINPATINAVAEKLMEAVVQGFGASFTELQPATPDYEMLANLEKNVYHFSSAKDYQQLRELTTLLKNGDELRTFAEFRREASVVLNKWVGTWLKTEYNLGVAGAQMAATWNRFEEHKDSMRYLQYQTVGDGRVREAHATLDNVAKLIDDPFWNTYYPPNGFNCRCDVIQLPSAPITPDADIAYPDIPAMFRSNLAKDNLIYPSGHPFFSNVPKEILSQVKPPDRDGTAV